MRFLALLGCLLPLALAGCGDSDHKSSNAEAGDTSNSAGGTNGDAADMSSNDNALADDVLLTLDDKHQVLGGGARLDVKELRPLVLLTVTTVYPNNHDDLILLQLGVNGVEHVMGQHTEALASLVPAVNEDATENAVASAQAYIGQVSYISQSGTLDVTLSNDGQLEGHFDAQLTPDVDPNTGAASSAPPIALSGFFSGKWSLICSSPVLNLPGDHSTPNSAYCRNLTF